MADPKYTALAEAIINGLGGISNVRSCQHCVTRLRFNVFDKGLVNEEETAKIKGVLGTKWLGEQFQVVIGLDAKFAYSEVIGLGVAGHAEGAAEADSAKPGKKTAKQILDSALSYISATMTAMIPIMIGAGLCKTIAVILGPDLLNVLPVTSDFYTLLVLIHSTMMYFLPVLLGYTACKALGVNALYGIFMGALLLAPDLRAMIGAREYITVYFANAPVADYAQAFLPMLLACPILKYVLKFFEKYIPKMFSILLVPLCTNLVMLFVMYVICGPFGSYLGSLFGALFAGLYEGSVIVRILGSIVLCIAWPFLILLGMHLPIVQLGIISLMTLGFDTIIWPTAVAYTFVIMGIGLGAFLKIKDKEEKGMALSAFITCFIGGISEPVIYGIIMKYKRGMYPILIGCGAGGLLIGIFAPKLFSLVGLFNIITMPLVFVGGDTTNHIIGTAILVLCLVVGTITSFLLVDYKQKK